MQIVIARMQTVFTALNFMDGEDAIRVEEWRTQNNNELLLLNINIKKRNLWREFF